MALLEVLTLNVAAALTKAVAKVWLHDEGLVGASEGVIETFKKRFDDLLVQRSTQRIFDRLQDDVAQRLHRFAETEFPQLPENDAEAAGLAVAGALASLPLTNAMFDLDLDSTRIESAVHRAAPRAFVQLGERGEDFARRLLNECCNYLVTIAGKLPDFQVAATKELLRRDTLIRDDLNRVLDELAQIRADAISTAVRKTADFEHQYRRTLVQQLDRLEMFGLRLAGAGTRNISLLSTYVPLASTPENAKTACPIEDAIAHRARVVIRGEAGLGKTTLMQFLAVQAARRVFTGSLAPWNDLVPFYVRLRDLVHAHTLPAARAVPLWRRRQSPGTDAHGLGAKRVRIRRTGAHRWR